MVYQCSLKQGVGWHNPSHQPSSAPLEFQGEQKQAPRTAPGVF